MKKLFLTLIVAFATVYGFAQEKVWEDIGQATEPALSLMSMPTQETWVNIYIIT